MTALALAELSAETSPELQLYVEPNEAPSTNIYESVEAFLSATVEQLQHLIPYEFKGATVKSHEDVLHLWQMTENY